MAQHTFAMGSKQAGSSSVVTAKKKGTFVCAIQASDGASLAAWDTGQIVTGVGSIYLAEDTRWVAIEFQSRFAGRAVEDVVVLQIAAPAAAPAVPVESVPVEVVPVAPVVKAVKPLESKEFRALMNKARRFGKSRRSYAKAQAALESALRLEPGNPEAFFELAVLAMKRKDSKDAIAKLAELAASTHSDVPRWRVEARVDVRFKTLRGDEAFRLAVGITRKPGEAISLYERLVAVGGRWEQEAIPCEEPQVNLTLRRDKKQRFDLVIRSKCQGTSETTRLDGTWESSGGANVALSFPNMESDDDKLTCEIELCSDNSGEDCVRCQPDPESEFLLRTVRR